MRTAAIDQVPYYYSYCACFGQKRIVMEHCIVANLQEVHHGGGDFGIICVAMSKKINLLCCPQFCARDNTNF